MIGWDPSMIAQLAARSSSIVVISGGKRRHIDGMRCNPDPMIGTGSLQAAGGRTGACTSDLDLTRFSSLDRIHAPAGERDPSIPGRVQQLDQALGCYNYSSIAPVAVAVASSCNCIAGPDGKYNVAADDRYIPRINFFVQNCE